MSVNRCIMCGRPIPEGKMICYECEYPVEPSFNTIQITVLINGIRDASKFAYIASKCEGDVVAKSGRFAVNAKSIMGILSLDLTKPIKVVFYGDISYEIKEEMKKFMIGDGVNK